MARPAANAPFPKTRPNYTSETAVLALKYIATTLIGSQLSGFVAIGSPAIWEEPDPKEVIVLVEIGCGHTRSLVFSRSRVLKGGRSGAFEASELLPTFSCATLRDNYALNRSNAVMDRVGGSASGQR